MPTLDDLQGICIGSEEIQSVCLGSQEIWNAVFIPPTKWLTFTSTGGNTLSLKNYGSNAPKLWYSTDAQNWIVWDYSAITVADGTSVYIAGKNSNGFSSSNSKYSTFIISGSGTIACNGDIMSLLDYSTDTTIIPCNFCYFKMFIGCNKLTSSPSLLATTLKESCYSNMFSDCKLLTIAPDLPATTLVKGCYDYMFSACSSLTATPVLSATTLTAFCYRSMFAGCTNLASVICLADNVSADNCLRHWLINVASTGTFTKSSNMSSWPSGADGIPTGWTVVDYPTS